MSADGGQRDPSSLVSDAQAMADLDEACRLIEKHGYGRRREELADAERILLGNPA